MKKLFLILFLMIVTASAAHARQYSFQGLTGSGTYPAQANLALDGWPVGGDVGPPVVPALVTGDLASGWSNGIWYTLRYNSVSSTPESLVPPVVVTPNDSGGLGRWVALDISVDELAANKIQLTPITAPAYSEGLSYYDSDKKSFVVYNDESGVSHEIGREGFIRVFNNTGSTILNGKVCYLSGRSGGFFTAGLARSDAAATSLGTIGVATHDIENNTFGYLTRWGTVNDTDTSGFTINDVLYLSATTSGDLTPTPPESPNYLIRVAQAGDINASTGNIEVNITVGTNTSGVIKIFNGSVLEDSSTSVVSNGTTVTLSYQQNPSGDLSLFFNGTFDTFDSTPAATIALTAGSDTAPTLNYVFIPESTMVLTGSTSGFPVTQHVPVATVLVQSAVSAQTDGVYKLHAWTDHLSDSNDQGHLSHVNGWIRAQNATWENGVDPTTTIIANGGAIDNVFFSNVSGNIRQLHVHAYPAMDMQVSDPMFVANDSITQYRRITDMSAIDLDSTGATLRSNNTFYSIVVWGVVSESGSDSKLYCNLPGGFYGSELGAQDDINRFSNFTIPPDFTGTGFLIARVILRYQTVASGTITEVQTEDLRGLVPSTAAGGGGVAGATEFSDNLWRAFNVLDNTKKMGFDVSGVSPATTRIITMPDVAVDLGEIAPNTAASHTQGTDTGLGVLGTKGTPVVADLIVFRNSESGDDLVTMTITEFKDFLQTLFWEFSEGIVAGSGTAFGGGYLSTLEDTDLGTNFRGWGIFGDLVTDYLLGYPLAAPTDNQMLLFPAPSSQTMADNIAKNISVGVWVDRSTVEERFIPILYANDGTVAPATAALVTSTNTAMCRAFDGAANEDVKILWRIPTDIDTSAGIKFSVVGYVGSATAPANAEIVAFSLAGMSLGNSDILSGAVGTAQTSSLTADATYVQYDKLETAFSSAITVTNLTGGETAHLNLIRLATTTDTYAQDFHPAGIVIKYQRLNNDTF